MRRRKARPDPVQLYRAARSAHGALLAGMAMVGAQAGDRCFVFLRNTADYVPLWFGLNRAGVVMVPGNIYLTEAEVDFQLRHCEPGGSS